MEQNYLKKLIKRNTTGPLLISLIFILVFFFASIGDSDKWSTLFSSLEEGNSVASVQDLYDKDKAYIQLKDADVYFLEYGIYDYTTVNGIKASEEKLSQVYGIILYDDGYLLTLLPKDYLDMTEDELSSVTAVANLEGLDDNDYNRDAYDEMITTLSDALETDPSAIRESVPEICVTLPENGRSDDQRAVVIINLLLLVSFLYFLYQIVILINYKVSRFYKKLNKIGVAEDIEYKINRSIADERYLYYSPYKSSSLIGLITSDYVIGKKYQSLVLHHTKDLIWVYLKVIKHKSYFITIRKTYQVLFYFKDVKNPISINCKKEAAAEELIRIVAANLPALTFYSKELLQVYKKNYQAFLKIVEEHAAGQNTAEDSQSENSRSDSNL